ncbi:hypothetical protein ES332_A06G204100v1 [Gossypium tomentosum]|uniref:Phorbol-ester/DAG-type domain-containing protein n=1 Tax=Gossypium tomentosum TaxID=34277 RepID=A0A5D2Q956_GOSTO|nr:hypothetical protein ES332_A06G204100v1 [Gossypium tomentosum]
MENENERHHKSVQQIQHPFHEEHPLVLVVEQSICLKAYCDGCGELLSAPCFTCIYCNYHLHKQCAEAPFKFQITLSIPSTQTKMCFAQMESTRSFIRSKEFTKDLSFHSYFFNEGCSNSKCDLV